LKSAADLIGKDYKVDKSGNIRFDIKIVPTPAPTG